MSDSFLDTNIIIYSLGNDVEKSRKSIELITKNPIISVQVLNESANTLGRKFSMSVKDIEAVIRRLVKECNVKPLTEYSFFSTRDQRTYKFSFYDCLIIASALEANCNILYSEDMQHEQVISNQLQIINPFRA